MNLQGALISATLLLTMQHPAMPKGMSHEEHVKQMENDDALRKRGADAMGFDQDVTTLESFPSMTDFYSVAVHELAHLLGFGTADSWDALVNNTTDTFLGPKSMTLNGGVAVPLDFDLSHWADGTTSNVLRTGAKRGIPRQ